MFGRGGVRGWALIAAAFVVVQVAAVPFFGHQASAAPGTGSITMQVRSARTVAAPPAVQKGAPVTEYKWLIAADDTGNPNDSLDNCLPARAGVSSPPDFADRCQWPSVRQTPGAVPVVAQGDQGALSAAVALPNLPVGKYLISVLADGYKIDGAHFTVTGGATTAVVVEMQPYPLPLGTVRLRVFEDTIPVDGTYEVGAEHGLAGFTAHLADVLGEVTTDYYGNPLCTKYVRTAPDATHPAGQVEFDADGKPVIAADSVGRCVSDANGDVVIPNLGPNRYASSVVAPTGQTWIQTTTLEGGHDWDIWTQEGDTGFDTEQTIGGELVPAVDFGFVAPKTLAAGSTGHVKGTAVVINTYVGGTGGVDVPNAGVAGASVRGPVDRPWIALSDLGGNDQMVSLSRGNADGTFDVANVPNGDYQLTVWDGPQELIIDSFNVTVSGGQTVDVGQKGVVGWFTDFEGSVFLDTNANGKRDPNEQGVPQFPVALKERDNSVMDQGVASVSTDATGRYSLRQSYPLSKFLVMEAFNTRYKTTGITYQADNQPTETTLLGAGVDVNVLPIIGLRGRVDWGVQTYPNGENGGIVGTVTYDTTRNELDPRFNATEPYQPGVPGIPVHLYAVARDANGDPIRNDDGSVQRGPELADTATSETWDQSRGCVARLHNGQPLTDQLALPEPTPDALCVESPMMGVQVRPSDTTAGNFGQTVNGNYGFTESTLNLYAPGDPRNPAPDHLLPLYADLAAGNYPAQPLVADDYLISVDIPNDSYGNPLYKVTKEEDVNVFDGDSYLPQENFPPSPALAADPPAGAQPQPEPGEPPSQGNGLVAQCAGKNHTVHVTNQNFVDGGGSPFEGQARPLCDQLMVQLNNGQATAPNVSLFTEVPLPTHFWGLTINDLGLTNDKRSIGYGEAQGLPNVPMGIYDWSGRLVDTVGTDFNGMYEALEPSTGTYNCPLPAGPCPNMYRFVGNDPGQPGHVNANYNPRFRTIATNFQAWPGLYTVTDTAPTQVAAVAAAPGSTQVNPVQCNLAATTPQIFRVSKPFVRMTDSGAARDITVTGLGFGASQGTGRITLDAGRTGDPKAQQVQSWTDRQITFRVEGALPLGPATLGITAANGQSAVNGLTIHSLLPDNVLGIPAVNPVVLYVNPPSSAPPLQVQAASRTFSTVQAALTYTTATALNRARKYLVVVWPGTPTQNNPRGDYYENIVIRSTVALQGVGAGGFTPEGTFVPGTELNGLGFQPENAAGTAWYGLVGGIPHAGPAQVPDAAVVTVLAPPGGAGTAANYTSIDGFSITGGSQSDNATNVNTTTGGTTTTVGAPGATVTQGGGIYVHGGVNFLRLSDNVVVGNSGSYGGGVRVGTPYSGAAGNNRLTLTRNRIRDNGGTNLAGGVGLFRGTTNYSVDHNDLCGNFSAEYGGGISHYGLSGGGDIAKNRIWFNQAYDEAGGIMIAGEVPANPAQPSTGSGQVSIHENRVQDNLANDDGGGIRLLQAGTVPISIVNNMVVDNISTHEGGGIALEDSTNVRLVNNTVMKNVTTATAATSNGRAAPAGLSTAPNSDQLQATLPAGSPAWSDPKMFNNIFWDNRAGTWNGQYVSGIASPQAPAGDPVRRWDMGSASPGVTLKPTYTVLQQLDPGVADSPTNRVGTDPQVRTPVDVSATILFSRTFPSFRQAVIVVQNVPITLLGDYHLANTTSAPNGLGVRTQTYPGVTVTAPTIDIDGNPRPATPAGRPDAGADETT